MSNLSVSLFMKASQIKDCQALGISLDRLITNESYEFLWTWKKRYLPGDDKNMEMSFKISPFQL